VCLWKHFLYVILWYLFKFLEWVERVTRVPRAWLYATVTWCLEKAYAGTAWVLGKIYAGVNWVLGKIYAGITWSLDIMWRVVTWVLDKIYRFGSWIYGIICRVVEICFNFGHYIAGKII